jgi:hypothetical protein
MKTLALSASVVLCLIGSSPDSSPDIAPNPVPRKGEALAPRGATSVAMVAETVTIRLKEDTAEVDAEFTMKNTGTAAETLEVGFPTAAQPGSYSVSKDGVKVKSWGPATIERFVAKVDGAEVKAESKDAERHGKDGYRGWLCWPMTYEAGQTRTVSVAYVVATNDPYYGQSTALRERQVAYILKTGAGWHGPIGSARVILELGRFTQKHVAKLVPEPTKKTETSCEWKLENFEPDADVLVEYRQFADAIETVAALGPKIGAKDAAVADLLDYSEALEMTGDSAAAADAFMRLHAVELERNVFAKRPRDPWECPAARAARLYRKAGNTAKAKSSAKEATARLDETIAALEDKHGSRMVILRKQLHRSVEDLRKTADECRALAAAGG